MLHGDIHRRPPDDPGVHGGRDGDYPGNDRHHASCTGHHRCGRARGCAPAGTSLAYTGDSRYVLWLVVAGIGLILVGEGGRRMARARQGLPTNIRWMRCAEQPCRSRLTPRPPLSSCSDVTTTGVGAASAVEVDDSPRAIHSPREPAGHVVPGLLFCCAALVVVLIAAIMLFLAQRAWPVLRTSGLQFFYDFGLEARQPGQYGILGDLLGTVTVALVALVVAFPISLATALAINEYVPGVARRVLIMLIDLLAAVPSLVYGLWGVVVFDNLVNGPTIWLTKYADFSRCSGPGQARSGARCSSAAWFVAVM